MNRRLIALSMACMTMTSVVACGEESKKSGKISDVAESAASVLPSGYKGIIASDAEYSLTDSKSIGYRKDIRNKANFDKEWLLISSGSKMKLYYADDWDKTAKGYKSAENEDKLTLEEIYRKNIGDFVEESPTEAEKDKTGYIEKSKRSSANSNANSYSKAVMAALTDADEMLDDANVNEIGYIVFKDGKVAEINYNGKNGDELIELLNKEVKNYFTKATEIPYAAMGCYRGSVRKLYIADDLSDKVKGCYPVDDDIYDTSFSEALDEIKDDYRIEVTEPPTGDGGEITLETGGKKFTLVTHNEGADEFRSWLDNSDYTEDECEIINFGISGSAVSERYDQMLAADEDIDVFVVEADWGGRYINDEKLTAPLEALGFTEDSFMNCYSYTLEIGRAVDGVNAGKLVGASSTVCPAGFAYRTDLAEQFLGIKTPEEMQYKVADWDRFIATACEVGDRSGGTVAFADSLGAMMNLYSQSRKTPWVTDGRVAFDESLQQYVRDLETAWKCGGIDKCTQWSHEWFDKGESGQIMGYFVSEWAIDEYGFIGQISEDTRGKWGLVQGPNPHFWGGALFVPNASMDNAEEARAFFDYTCVNSESMTVMAEQGRFVNNKEVMESLVNKGCGNDFGKELFNGQDYMKVLHETALAIDNKGLVTPYDADVRNNVLKYLTIELQDMGEGGSVDYNKLIDIANDEIKKLHPELN